MALSSAVTYLSHKTLIFHDFPGLIIQFHDFPGVENKMLKFHDFPGFPWPVRTLTCSAPIKTGLLGELIFLYAIISVHTAWQQD